MLDYGRNIVLLILLILLVDLVIKNGRGGASWKRYINELGEELEDFFLVFFDELVKSCDAKN